LAILNHLGIKKVPVWEIFGTTECMCYPSIRHLHHWSRAQLYTQCTIWSL